MHEREALFENIRALAAEGVTSIIVSHDLGEVLAISDAVTVFRDGRRVATMPAAAWTRRTLVDAMFGDRVVARSQRTRRPGEELLRVSDVALPGVLDDVALSLREGEILGIAGLVGALLLVSDERAMGARQRR